MSPSIHAEVPAAIDAKDSFAHRATAEGNPAAESSDRSVVGRRDVSPEPARVGNRVVIVGGGMAGHALCESLVRRAVVGDLRLTIIGDEPRLPYDRVRLSKVFETGPSTSEDADPLTLASSTWYRDHAIEIRTGRRVVSVDREAKRVTDDAGEHHEYDQLVFATGSRAWVPPIPGIERRGVFVYRTRCDLDRIRHWCDRHRTSTGLVIGGGLLGLEAAKVLDDQSIRTTVVEVAPGLMPQQLNSVASKMLRSKLEQSGISVRTVAMARSVDDIGGAIAGTEDDFAGLRVLFASGEVIDAGIIVVAAGIRPRDELARQSGLNVGPTGGIVVDDHMRTSDPNIAAIGECVCWRDRRFGLVAPCYQMADVLAARLAGDAEPFVPCEPSAELKFMGIDVVTLGRRLGDLPGGDTLRYEDADGSRQLLIENGRLVGATVVGRWDDLPTVRLAIDRGWPMSLWRRQAFRREGRFSPGGWGPALRRALKLGGERTAISDWPAEAIVCGCRSVSCGEIREAVQAIDVGDWKQPGTIERATQTLCQRTSAGTACGSCRPMVQSFLGVLGEDALLRTSPLSTAVRVMAAFSVLAAALVVAYLVSPPLPIADSVRSPLRRWEWWWRDETAKQWTGYTALSLMLLSLAFSVRKRLDRLSFLSYPAWRVVHVAAGAAMLALILFHTGVRLGEGLNAVLSATLLAVVAVGSALGLTAALESRGGPSATVWRDWRRRLWRLHFWAFWPLPVLIALHVLSFYWFTGQ